MSTNELTAKIRELREPQALIDEAQAEPETIRDTIKSHMDEEKPMNEKILTPLKAIRAKCLDCVCGNPNEVRLCTISRCPLYPYRFGKNPYIAKREYTEEQREAAREQMRFINAKRHG